MIIDDDDRAGEGPGEVLPLRRNGVSHPALDRSIQGFIGSRLRAMYDDLAQQPVPDRFVELLGKLERRGEEDGR